MSHRDAQKSTHAILVNCRFTSFLIPSVHFLSTYLFLPMYRLCIYKKKEKKTVAWEKASDIKIHFKASLYTAGFFAKDRQPEQNQRNTHQSYFRKGQGQKTLQEKRNGHLCTGRIKFFQNILARHVGGTWPQKRAKKAPTVRNEHIIISPVSSCLFPSGSQQPSIASAPLEETSDTNKFLQDLQTETEWSLGKRPDKENGSLLIH